MIKYQQTQRYVTKQIIFYPIKLKKNIQLDLYKRQKKIENSILNLVYSLQISNNII